MLENVILDNTYKISHYTNAILPHFSGSLIYDHFGLFYCKKMPIDLIQEACISYSRMNFQELMTLNSCCNGKPPPIAISQEKFIYAFTSSLVSSPMSHWLFVNNLAEIYEIDNQTFVVFKNETKLKVGIPVNELKTIFQQTIKYMEQLTLYRNSVPNRLSPY